MEKITLERIDLSTHEGRLLNAALAILSTALFTDRTPWDIIDTLYESAEKMDRVNNKEDWKKLEERNIYAKLDRLGMFTLEQFNIGSGDPFVDAIKIMEGLKGAANETNKLQDFFLKELPGEIKEGTPVDNAIRLLSPKTKRFKPGAETNKITGEFNGKSVLSKPLFDLALTQTLDAERAKIDTNLKRIREAGEEILQKASRSMNPDNYCELERLLVVLYRHYANI